MQNARCPSKWTAAAVRGAARRCRWCNQLDPNVKKFPFSEWEDAIIVTLQAVRQLPRCSAGAATRVLSCLASAPVVLLSGPAGAVTGAAGLRHAPLFDD